MGRWWRCAEVSCPCGEGMSDRIAKKVEEQLGTIEAHPSHPGEGDVQKTLLSDHKNLVAFCKKWSAALRGYSGSMQPCVVLANKTDDAIKKWSGNNEKRWEVCRKLPE